METLMTRPIDPKQELNLIDYINELDIAVKPALRVLYNMEEDAFQMDNQDLKCLLFATMETWGRIDEIFMRHNRKVKGLPEVPTSEHIRSIWQAAKLPKAENQTNGAAVE